MLDSHSTEDELRNTKSMEGEDNQPSMLELRKEALHGIIGEMVKTIGPYTEADPAAVLLLLLPDYSRLIRGAF